MNSSRRNPDSSLNSLGLDMAVSVAHEHGMRYPGITGLFIVLMLCGAVSRAQEYDVVVYGGTSGGVIAAVQAKAMGKTVVIVGPDKHLGGLTSGGLGYTDTGNKTVIGGLARDFYHRVWSHYDRPDAWRWQQSNPHGYA